MARKVQKINVIMHIPNDSALRNLEEETNNLYVHIVQKRLNNTNLTRSEKKDIIRRLAAEFEKAPE